MSFQKVPLARHQFIPARKGNCNDKNVKVN